MNRIERESMLLGVVGLRKLLSNPDEIPVLTRKILDENLGIKCLQCL